MKFLFAMVCLFLLSSAPVRAGAPEECLNKISGAIENADAAAFAQAIDLDSVLSSSLEVFLKNPRNSQLTPMLALLFSDSAGQGGQAIRNLLLQEARAFVLSGVSSGAFAGHRPDSSKTQGLLAPLFANASMGRKEIRSVGTATKDGDDWLMPFTVHDYGNDRDYLLAGRFGSAQGGFCLRSIENLDQLLEQIQKEVEAD